MVGGYSPYAPIPRAPGVDLITNSPMVTAPPKTPKRWLRPMVVGVLALLVIVVGIQAFEVSRLSGKLASTNRRAARSDARIVKLESSSSRVQATLAGGMDTAAIAAAALPSVFEVKAGDFLGTSWGVAHPAGGGTDMITNFHVIAAWYKTGKRAVTVHHESQEFTASVKRIDKAADLALLHVPANFPILAIQKTPVLGEPLVVLGEPYGFEGTVTAGVVSSLNRKVPGLNDRVFIQFDAPINPGNSGGPIIDAHGQVLGITSDEFVSGAGLGFAIPITIACADLRTC